MRLDDWTILRFAHVFRSSTAGGMERYLGDLNRRLLERNRMRIVQVYLTSEQDAANVSIEPVGLGQLIWVPSVCSGTDSTLERRWWQRPRQWWRNNAAIRHDRLLSLLDGLGVNLGVFHWLSRDAMNVQRQLIAESIPFVVVNHFENSRLERPLERTQLSAARGVGGVSALGVPERLKPRFMNLSDGIDTGFFDPKLVFGKRREVGNPTILLPARVTEGKGHLDAIQTLDLLHRAGLKVDLVFVGRLESRPLHKSIAITSKKLGLGNHVILLGEVTADQLRELYAACSLVIFPTYSEGLGRVLLEAQAMKKPVIAYNVGGVSEAICHEKTGYLVPKGDIGGLARYAAEVLQDTHWQRVMGECGRAYVLDKFTLDALARRHELFYQDAVTSHGVSASWDVPSHDTPA